MPGGNGIALAALGAGAIFLYSGIKGKSVTQSLQYIIQGKNPGTAPESNQFPAWQTVANPAVTLGGNGTGTTGGSPVANTGSVQSILQQTAAQFGWTAANGELGALQNIEMHEAGYNPLADNPSSHAFGIAQAYGHGNGAATQGTDSNMYGGYGLTDAQAKLANSGDASMQALWMCNYIKATYGRPSVAWAQYFNHPGGVGSY